MSFALSGIGRRANDQQAAAGISDIWTSVKFSMVMGKAVLFFVIALLSISRGYFCSL
jgi:hypothetical protein